MNELAQIRLVIALGFPLETFLDCLLNFGQAFEYVIIRWSADVEAFRQLRYLPDSGLVEPPDFLAIH